MSLNVGYWLKLGMSQCARRNLVTLDVRTDTRRAAAAASVIGDAPGGLPTVARPPARLARQTDSGSGIMHAAMRYGHLGAIPPR